MGYIKAVASGISVTFFYFLLFSLANAILILASREMTTINIKFQPSQTFLIVNPSINNQARSLTTLEMTVPGRAHKKVYKLLQGSRFGLSSFVFKISKGG